MQLSFVSLLLASLFLQAGAVGFFAGFWLTSYLLFSLAANVLVLRLKAEGILSQERLRWLAIVLMIATLGVGSITLRNRFHKGGFAALYAPEVTTGFGSGKYRGVILWTDAKPAAVLLLPPELGRGQSQLRKPLNIPFDGVYWFFKFPDRQPPKNSYSVHGNPSAMAFRSSDLVPLEMEARQNFVTSIEMSCCSRIELAILNADRSPGAVSLELVLVNLRLPGEPSQTLGRRPVTSTPLWVTGSEDQPTSEVLSFAIPKNPRIRKFDAARVNFARYGNRRGSSAKIAIQQFTLVPRGL